MKLLLHTCCAPCSVECVRVLRLEGLETDLYWYNPNIHPSTEYRARRDCLSAFAGEEGLALIMVDEYGLRDFIAGMPPFPAVPGPNLRFSNLRFDRCSYCYCMRLERTAQKAKEAGYDAFSTSLLISPYQNHEALKKAGEDCAKRCGVEFYYRDFRPFYKEGRKKARERNYYMQKYCGCIFSEEERYLKKRDRGQGRYD